MISLLLGLLASAAESIFGPVIGGWIARNVLHVTPTPAKPDAEALAASNATNQAEVTELETANANEQKADAVGAASDAAELRAVASVVAPGGAVNPAINEALAKQFPSEFD